MAEVVDGMMVAYQKAVAERDEARAETARLEKALGFKLSRNPTTKRKLDEAEAEIARLRAAEAEAFAARANETRYREALERIAEGPATSDSAAWRKQVARLALDTQAREYRVGAQPPPGHTPDTQAREGD